MENIISIKQLPLIYLQFICVSPDKSTKIESVKMKILYSHGWQVNPLQNTGSSKEMDLKSTRRIYSFGVLKCSEKLKVLDLH